MATKVRSAKGSKAKGSQFEREVAAHLCDRIGLECRRALLSGGGRNDGGADLDDTPLVHMELKRTETFAPYAAMKQAEESISKSRNKLIKPVVINRRNNMKTGQSLVVMRLDDWLPLYELWLKQNGAMPIRASSPNPDSAAT